jgi:hypothetical protein
MKKRAGLPPMLCDKRIRCHIAPNPQMFFGFGGCRSRLCSLRSPKKKFYGKRVGFAIENEIL